MKTIIFTLIVLFAAISLVAQPAPDTKPDAELTFDEAVLRIEKILSRVTELENQLNTLKGKSKETTDMIEKAKKDLKDCQDALAAMIGASSADVDAFRQRLGALQNKVREMQKLSNDELADRRSDVEALDAELAELKTNKISILPEFFDRIVQLGRDIKGLYREKQVRSYTVGTWAENRDCLWNIAGKMEIYADPFMWPKIWQANQGEIRNPDIIFPGQVLTLPPKGPKDADALKMERKYYRLKREAEAQTGATGADNSTTGQQ